MNNNDFEFTFVADQPADVVFNAINNVRGWWNTAMEGISSALNDEFSVRFGDVHYSKQKLIEFIPNKKVVWLVTDSKLNFLSDKGEWTNTKISFEISGKGEKTQVHFRHEGLIPKIECYNACSNAWAEYLTDSLLRLVTTGQGQPFGETVAIK